MTTIPPNDANRPVNSPAGGSVDAARNFGGPAQITFAPELSMPQQEPAPTPTGWLPRSIGYPIARFIGGFYPRVRPFIPPFLQQPVCRGIDTVVGPGPGGVMPAKPAIYLYPQSETPVSIRLNAELDLAVNIPAYHHEHGWQVLAHPDGRLKDLNPEYTNLSYYPRNVLGLEYLDEVENSGFYPYIYWDSTTPMTDAATIEQGWLVDKADVAAFFENTLPLVGFNTQEMQDFVAYWQPKLQHLPDATHFKFGFVFTDGMNDFAPMTISPAPTALHRVFLKIEVNPDRTENQSLQPQLLESFVREGFTVFEWGGGFVASPNYSGTLPQIVSYEPVSAS